MVVLAALAMLFAADPAWAWIDENRSEVSGEVGDVEWEGIAHIGFKTSDKFGIYVYRGSTLTQTDTKVHALRAKSRGEEWCGLVLNDVDWDVEWKASKTWVIGGSERGEATAGACSDVYWLPYMLANKADHRVWLSNGDTDGDDHSASVTIPTFSPPSW